MGEKTDSKSKDEAVSGAAIAAAIMKRLPADVRERVLETMEQSAPEVCASVESFLFSTSSLAHLPGASLKAVLQIAPASDIALCVHAASGSEREKIVESVPESKRSVVQDAVANWRGRDVSSESLKAKRRMLALVSELKLSAENTLPAKRGRYA